MTLIELTPGALYLPGAVNAGVVAAPDGGAVLIDTGQDKDHAKAIVKACRAAGLEPRAIVTTHHHADHCGGNDYLVRNLGLPVYAPPFEAALIAHPLLEPMYLFSGASPIAPLRNKWLMAKPAPVHHLIEGDSLQVAGVTLTIIPAPGHAPNQVAIGYGDICYASDAVFGPETLAKYQLPYATDVAQQIESIQRLRATGYRVYLPAHGEPTEDVDALAELNLAAIRQAVAWVRAACHPPAETTEVVARVAEMAGLTLAGIPQYYLFKSVVKAYLSYLADRGEVSPRLEGNRLWWEMA